MWSNQVMADGSLFVQLPWFLFVQPGHCINSDELAMDQVPAGHCTNYDELCMDQDPAGHCINYDELTMDRAPAEVDLFLSGYSELPTSPFVLCDCL